MHYGEVASCRKDHFPVHDVVFDQCVQEAFGRQSVDGDVNTVAHNRMKHLLHANCLCWHSGKGALDHLSSMLAASQCSHINLSTDQPREAGKRNDARGDHIRRQSASAVSTQLALAKHSVCRHEEYQLVVDDDDRHIHRLIPHRARVRLDLA